MDTGIRLNDAISAHRHLIDGVSRRLDHLAAALAVVGLEKLADELCAIADDLPPSAKTIQDAYSLDLSANLAHSEAMMGNLLKATIVGALGPREKA